MSLLTHRALFPLAVCALLMLALAGAEAAPAESSSADSGHRAGTGGTAPTPGAKLRRQGPDAPVAVTGYVFPIRGPHSYGTSINRYGAARGGRRHRGQDVMAPAGALLVAARGGRVTHRAFQAAAGNYLVIASDDGTDHVYMHLLAAAVVAQGERVRAGEPIGRVGQTGNATAPHLHFEVWTAHWYSGGRPLDPLARLRAWDAIT